MACGFLVTAILFLVFCYITNERVLARHFKRDHPILSILLILTGGYIVTYMVGSLLVFFVGILLPFSGTIQSHIIFFKYKTFIFFSNIHSRFIATEEHKEQDHEPR